MAVRRGTPALARFVPRVLRNSDGKLTDKIYTDENLLGIETAVDVLPTYTEPASPMASPF